MPLQKTQAKKEIYHDPVCGLKIQKREPVASSQLGTRMYYFCSEACKAKFDDDPERYLRLRDCD